MSFAHPARLSTGSTERPDDLDAAFVELGLDPGHVAELGRANRSEILRMREQHAPGAAHPFMKANAALRGVGFEIRCEMVESQGHGRCSCVVSWTVSGALPQTRFRSAVRERLASSQDDRLG